MSGFGEEATQNCPKWAATLMLLRLFDVQKSTSFASPHKHEINTFLSCTCPLLVALDYYVISVYQYNLACTNSESEK